MSNDVEACRVMSNHVESCHGGKNPALQKLNEVDDAFDILSGAIDTGEHPKHLCCKIHVAKPYKGAKLLLQHISIRSSCCLNPGVSFVLRLMASFYIGKGRQPWQCGLKSAAHHFQNAFMAAKCSQWELTSSQEAWNLLTEHFASLVP